MSFETDPPYRHRVLMPLVANALGELMPFAESHTLFLASQLLVLLALFPLTHRLLREFFDGLPAANLKQ